ncbi:hypothetical protein TNCT_283151 [Trichonephila clavata]|uniref:Uncharacterized protein n=1 Tax=Trichonephila clavata TaxID=2740835 RepID=A0A8X6LB17_TRICU|nr:hypothetical protein TNCT_283151 [Trichonephila clavata]
MLNIGLKFKTFTGIGEVTPLRRVEISCDENKAPIINALDENSLLVQPVRTRVYGTANKQPILSKKKGNDSRRVCIKNGRKFTR